jgi:HD-GYP domain-containing protein (c-di-GMP phosphodiesterase class II)
MSDSVLVTADLQGRTSRREIILTGDMLVSGEVVVGSPAGLQQIPSVDFSLCANVILGAGEVRTGVPVFLRLPATATDEELGPAIDAAFEILRLREQTRGHERVASRARERQLDLAKVGIALTQERDLDRLLSLILSTARDLVSADAGSLYLIETREEQRQLRYVLTQNDSVRVSFSSHTVPVDPSSFAGYVAQTGEVVTVADVRRLPDGVPYRFNASFDHSSGYHTRSLLTVPIGTRAGETIGVLQLINRKKERAASITDGAIADTWVTSFGAEDVAVIRALAAQAAVAIENTRLVAEIEQLFESFVHASVTAIEQRDPTTSGHSQRVAHYTVGLAKAVEQSPPPPFAGISFTRDQITQLRYAGLLHDFGKVGVREAVLTKGTKLFPERIALVRERFDHARRAYEVRALRKLLATICANGRVPGTDDLAAVEAAIARIGEEFDSLWQAVEKANEPAVLATATRYLLTDAEGTSFPGFDGNDRPLLLPDEIHALSVPKGSLDEAERREIESHVTHSYQFLLTIPWPKRLRRVPEIAFGHHEKLNGSGYPNRLVADTIPAEVRMMTVCDIYDALAAQDRPYKRAVSPERALGILEAEAADGALDPDLLRVFIEARIYERPTPGVRQ